jgi:hypothetical protein
MSLLGPAAVYLRIFGKTLAFTNACFILVASILQFTNAYNNCWCSSAAMTLGTKKAWVVLFASDAQIVAVSKIPWLIGILMNVVVDTVTLVFILRYTGDSGDEELPLVKEQLPQGMSRVRWKCVSILKFNRRIFFVDFGSRHVVRISMMITRSYGPVRPKS